LNLLTESLVVKLSHSDIGVEIHREIDLRASGKLSIKRREILDGMRDQMSNMRNAIH
jgi:hypothetical protein